MQTIQAQEHLLTGLLTLMAHRAFKDRLARQAQQARSLALQVPQARLEPLVALAPQAHKVLQDPQVHREHKASKAFRVNKVLQDLQVQQDQQAHKAWLDLLVRKATKVLPDPLGLLAHKVRKVMSDQQVRRVTKA